MSQPLRQPESHAAADVSLAGRLAAHDHAAFETLMRRHNTRLFRVARAILRDDRDAEDALQDAYLDAYQHIDRFRGESTLLTWLTRIVINQALMRVRKEKRQPAVVSFAAPARADSSEREVTVPDESAEPASNAVLRAELRQILERRIDDLPLAFRTVFVMREVQEMSVEETAASLLIPPATVRSRLFRAKALLRESLAREVDAATLDVFSFDGARCDRIVANVIARLPAANTPS